MSFYLVSVETGAIKIVLIIKQQDSNNANVEVCSVLWIFGNYLSPNKINNAAILGSSEDDASGHCLYLGCWNVFI